MINPSIIQNNQRIAKEHTVFVEENYADEIAECAKRSIIYDSAPKTEWPDKAQCQQTLIKADATGTLFSLRQLHPNARICLLNFASFKNPGGGFLKGSVAQEEALCHDSFLYSVLKTKRRYYEENSRNLNRGLYVDRAIYSKNVRFFKDNDTTLADVITCAAPNRSVGLKYKSFTDEENSKTLAQRIQFVKSVIRGNKPDIAILGAWGCGVFKQDPAVVAHLWKTGDIPAPKVVYAIPDTGTFNVFRSI